VGKKAKGKAGKECRFCGGGHCLGLCKKKKKKGKKKDKKPGG